MKRGIFILVVFLGNFVVSQVTDTLYIAPKKVCYLDFSDDPLAKVDIGVPQEVLAISYDKSTSILSLNLLGTFTSAIGVFKTLGGKRYICKIIMDVEKSMDYYMFGQPHKKEFKKETAVAEPKVANQEVVDSLNIPLSVLERNIIDIDSYPYSPLEVVNNDITLSLKGFYNYRGTFYMVFDLVNNSTVSFDILREDFGTFFLKEVDSDLAREPIKPQAIHRFLSFEVLSDGVQPARILRLMYVFKKFNLLKSHAFVMNLYEKAGTRNLKMVIGSEVINTPVLLERFNGVLKVKKKKRVYITSEKQKSLGLSLGYLGDNFDVDFGYYRMIKTSPFGYFFSAFSVFSKSQDVSVNNFGLGGGFLYRKFFLSRTSLELTGGLNYSYQSASGISGLISNDEFLFGGNASIGLLYGVSKDFYISVGVRTRIFKPVDYVSQNVYSSLFVKFYLNL